ANLNVLSCAAVGLCDASLLEVLGGHVNLDPAMLCLLPHGADRNGKVWIGERANGDTDLVGVFVHPPIDCRAAIGTEVVAAHASGLGRACKNLGARRRLDLGLEIVGADTEWRAGPPLARKAMAHDHAGRFAGYRC